VATADPILDRLKALHPKAIDLSLDRVAQLMAALGHPERKLPPVIHVAGTKGKGSTVAIMRAILEAAGRRVHAYTSPHLVRFNERIRLGGKLIDEPHLTALLEEVEHANNGKPITFFEVTTAAAFLAFARAPADILLLEVGLGGRLDATNLVDRPLASVLTPISIDHVQFLGDTIVKIAAEKAGIIKRDVPAIIGLQPAEALTVIAARGRELHAPLFRRDSDWMIEIGPSGFTYQGRRKLSLPLPSLPGHHQIDNAALAIATLDRIDAFTLDDRAFQSGLQQIDWPARLQHLTGGALVSLLRPGTQLWLDGGHNEDAARVLAAWMKEQPGRFDAVIGMLSTKDADKFMLQLAPYVRRLRTVTIPGEAAAIPADQLAAIAVRAGVTQAAPSPDVKSALIDLAPQAERVMITGSLYLGGTVLAANAA
jgi:dihydrofolate synthase/folylpolyglutamate synthase